MKLHRLKYIELTNRVLGAEDSIRVFETHDVGSIPTGPAIIYQVYV